MRLLKRVWQLWSDVLTFAWLDRLSEKQPRLAIAIFGSLIILVFGFAAWYYLDPRNIVTEKDGVTRTSWTLRIIWGVISGIASLLTVRGTALAMRHKNLVAIEWIFARRPKTRKAKR